MTKDEMVYAFMACDSFNDAMKNQILLDEEKGPWGKLSVEECCVGALENMKKILGTSDPLLRISAAVHAAMYCFFLVDNEAEGILAEQEKDPSYPPGFVDSFGRMMADLFDGECK